MPIAGGDILRTDGRAGGSREFIVMISGGTAVRPNRVVCQGAGKRSMMIWAQCEIDATEGNFAAAKTVVGRNLLLKTIHVQLTYGTSPLLSGNNQ